MRTLKNVKNSSKRLTIPMTAAAALACFGIGTAVTHNNAHASQFQGNQASTAEHDTNANQILATHTLLNGMNNKQANVRQQSAPQANTTTSNNNATGNSNSRGDQMAQTRQPTTPQVGDGDNTNNNTPTDNGDDGDDNNNPSNNIVAGHHTVVNNNDHDYYGDNGNDDHDDAALAAAITAMNKNDQTQNADTLANIKDNDMNAALARQQSDASNNESIQSSLQNQQNSNSAALNEDQIKNSNAAKQTSLKNTDALKSLQTSIADSSAAQSKVDSLANSVASSQSEFEGVQDQNRATVASAAQGAINSVNDDNNLTDAQRSQILNGIENDENILNNEIANATSAGQLAGLSNQATNEFGKAGNEANNDQTVDTNNAHNNADTQANNAVNSEISTIQGNSNLNTSQKSLFVSELNSEASVARTNIGNTTNSGSIGDLLTGLNSNINALNSTAVSQGNDTRATYLSATDSTINSQRNQAVNSVNANTNLSTNDKSFMNSEINSAANNKLDSANHTIGVPSDFEATVQAPATNNVSETPGVPQLPHELGSDKASRGPVRSPEKQVNPSIVRSTKEVEAPGAADVGAVAGNSKNSQKASSSADSMATTEEAPTTQVGGDNPFEDLVNGNGSAAATDNNNLLNPAGGNPFDTGNGGNSGDNFNIKSQTNSMATSNRNGAESVADGAIDSETNSLVGSINNDSNLTSGQRSSMASGVYSEENDDKRGIANAQFIPNIQSYETQLSSFANNESSAASHDTTQANHWFQNNPYNSDQEAPKGYHYNANGDLLSNNTPQGPGAQKVINDENEGIDDDGLGDNGYLASYDKAYREFAKVYGNNNPYTAAAAAGVTDNPFTGIYGPYAGINDAVDEAGALDGLAYGDPYAYADGAYNLYNAANAYNDPLIAANAYNDPYANPLFAANAYNNPALDADVANNDRANAENADAVANQYEAGANLADAIGATSIGNPYIAAGLNPYYTAAAANAFNDPYLASAASAYGAPYALTALNAFDNVYDGAYGAYNPLTGLVNTAYPLDFSNVNVAGLNGLALSGVPSKTKWQTTYLAGYKPVVKGAYTPFGISYGVNFKPVTKKVSGETANTLAGAVNTVNGSVIDPVYGSVATALAAAPEYKYTTKYLAGYKPVVKGYYTPFGEAYRLSYKPVTRKFTVKGNGFLNSLAGVPFQYTTKYLAGYKPVVKGFYTPYGEAYGLSYKPVMKSLRTYGNWLAGPTALTVNGYMPTSYVDGLTPIVSGAYYGTLTNAVIPTSLIPFEPTGYYYGVPFMSINGIAYTESDGLLVPMGIPASYANAVSSGTVYEGATPVEGNGSSVNNSSVSNTEATPVSGNSQQQGTLPQTGESSQVRSYVLALGLTLLGLGAAGAEMINKHREQE